MPTGIQIRGRMEKRGLVFLGKSTALGTTSTLIDTTRQKMSKLSPQEYGDAYIRVIAGDSNNNGYVGQVERINPETGAIYVSPAVSNAFASGASYEIWKHGIWPDEPDRARDRALTGKCTYPRLKPLSMLSDVSEWSTSAYSAGTGGVSNATAATSTLDFPHEYFEKAMRVTNSGAAGRIVSAALNVQPGQRYQVSGYVSERSGATSTFLQANDLTNSTVIDLDEDWAATLIGWQFFTRWFEVPATCEKVELRLGANAATAITDWAGVALLPEDATEIVLPSRVTSPKDVGRVYYRTDQSDLQSADQRGLHEIACWRERAAARVRLRFPHRLGRLPILYEERHRFAALQSDYLTTTDRTTGDAASTDAALDYVEAATTVELLESRRANPDLDKIYLVAVKDLNYLERQFGPDPKVPPSPARARPYLPRL